MTGTALAYGSRNLRCVYVPVGGAAFVVVVQPHGPGARRIERRARDQPRPARARPAVENVREVQRIVGAGQVDPAIGHEYRIEAPEHEGRTNSVESGVAFAGRQVVQARKARVRLFEPLVQAKRDHLAQSPEVAVGVEVRNNG